MKLAAPVFACTGALLAAAVAAQPVLEEVVVTAGFRDRALMDAAGSATVVGTDTIELRAAEHLEAVLEVAPNVTYSSAASRARFVQVRGVGDLEQFVDPKHYPSVGISLDDINLGGTANSAMLFDTEQVEILRGPQGTRFGMSALAGLVNIQSRRATREFEGYVTGGLADYGTASVGAALSGPLGETVSARLAVQQHESDGYIRNRFLGREDTNGYEESTVRANLRFEPSAAAAYSFTALSFDGDNGYDAFSLDNTRTTLSDQPGRDRQSSAALAARGEWRIGTTSTVEAVATWLDSDLDYGFDEDWTYVGICDGTLCDPVLDFFSNTDRYTRDRTETTLDLRWLAEARSSSGLARELVVGVYGQERDEDLHRRYYGDFFSTYATERRAVYAQLQTEISERIGLTVGYRVERFEDAYGDSFGLATDSDDDLANGELSVSYQLDRGTLLYASLSRGDKAGGVNTEASSSLPLMQPQFRSFVEPRLRIATETLTNREIGVKARFRDGRMQLRAAVFDMSRDDAQLESWIWDGVNFLWVGLLDNVGASNRGAELEASLAIGTSWEVSAALGRLDSDVDEIVTFDLDLGEFVTRRGIDQARAPSWQYSFTAEWRPNQSWTARMDLEGGDGSRFGYYHDGMLGRYSLLHASLRRRVGPVELTLWGRNLTDEGYAVHGLYFGNDPRKGWVNETYLQWGEPRLMGVSMKYAF